MQEPDCPVNMREKLIKSDMAYMHILEARIDIFQATIVSDVFINLDFTFEVVCKRGLI
jgi:hypothetical protein